MQHGQELSVQWDGESQERSEEGLQHLHEKADDVEDGVRESGAILDAEAQRRQHGVVEVGVTDWRCVIRHVVDVPAHHRPPVWVTERPCGLEVGDSDVANVHWVDKGFTG